MDEKEQYINQEYPALKKHARETHANIEATSPILNRLDAAFNKDFTTAMLGVDDD